MIITIQLPPAKEAASLEQWLLDFAEKQVAPASIARLQKTDPKEWARQFDAWVASHRSDLPVPSDEAMSRKSIYPDLS